MSSDTRSIDFANSASIDMMALNNKVVNMRQVVKRTKVHVINKLCKNIAALKKKKGTEEQKAQNLRKAERLIEEIDSIKRLREDKVSKYSLANTMTFTDVCKSSLLAGPRAMARLADHPIMQKVVGDFRTQHPDWRDLAAYLLIKQTGRRFKTKKQKQGKKLSRTVENIHASETMTKAYIQERFGQDGLKKAEQRFERKRKRAPFDKNLQPEKQDENDDTEQDSKRKREETEVDYEDQDTKEDEDVLADREKSVSDSNDVKIARDGSADKDKKIKTDESIGSKAKQTHISSSESEPEIEKSVVAETKNSISPSPQKLEKQMPKNSVCSKRLKNEPDENTKTVLSDLDSFSGDESPANLQEVQEAQEAPDLNISPKKKNECVVKELDINKIGTDAFDKNSSEEEESHTSSDSESDIDGSSQNMSNRQKKKAKLRNKKVPVILTNKPQKAISDPFFVGTDEEEEDDDAPNDFDEALAFEPVDDEVGSGAVGERSMFYNPHGEDVYRKGVRIPARGWSNPRGGGRWQRQDTGRGWDRGGRSSGQQRGRGMSLGGTKTRGDSRGGYPHSNQSFGRPRHDNIERMKPESESSSRTNNSVRTPGSSEKLHPSWEASKKRKAEQSGIQAFKGSKITFDDDD
ncbi:serum response factor-binding protein 1 [Elysia marginata]|uniref:Serum response factor-binding protein 1 n=1 Tax=Elysia marginata TaxID=1093978 RepID=A0AAV4FW46_9GAST|nr:serum response factor-binding protein 1 [Elysia marginata]